MGFFSKIGKALKKVIGVVAAVAAAVFIPGAGAFIGKALLGAAISIGASKLLAKRGADAPAGGDGGGRVQLPPATDNKLPVVYGQAWVGGPITDAKISTDQKYMWYCIAFAEKTDTGTYSYDTSTGVYYDGKLVQFGVNGQVTGLVTNNSGLGTAQVDTRMAGKIYIWLFTNGSSSGVNTGGQTAIQIMSDSVTGGGIYPTDLRWNGSLYTSNGQSADMTNTAFAIVRVEYNPDAGTTGLGSLQVKLTNNMGASNGARPGTVILDYLTNDRYGCNIPLAQIDTASLTALDTYSNQSIAYIDVNGNPQTQPYRYRINGSVNTAATCLTNLQTMVDSCDSWLQYSEATGQWRVIMNAPYAGLESSLFLVDSNNLIGGIQINPVDLNETYNQIEVAYPNNNIKDQTDYQVIDLTNPANWSNQVYDDILSPNEAVNRLNISLPLVNSAIQSKYLAARRLLQSREDLVISCDLDYSGIQLEAGDVIRVGQPDYGWGPISTNPLNPYKLFRVSSVNEQTTEDGSLVASIEAFEYNDSVYADNAITDFIPADNTGLTDPNVISQPCPPLVTTLDDIATPVIDAFKVETCVPDQGTVLYMDFNYGTTNVVTTHQLYRTIQSAGGIPFTNSDSANAVYNNVSISVNDLPAANYYWSATARNDTAGRYSDGSAAYAWGGANIQPYNANTTRGGIPAGSYRPNSIPASAIAGGGGISGIEIEYTGNTVVASANTLNFRGGVIATNPTANVANVTFIGLTEYPYGTYNYTIGDPPANIVTTPVNINTFGINYRSANFDIPKYIEGNDPGANYIWPWYQGTSDTANGYVANSTGSFTPATAAVFNIENGDNGYYILDVTDYTFFGNTGITAPSVQILGEYCFVANVDATIQLVKWGSNIANPNNIQGLTTNFSQVDLIANVPQQIRFYDSITGPTDISGILIRNITPNSNVTAVTGAFLVSANIPPPSLL
jgi:hypothetical protein